MTEPGLRTQPGVLAGEADVDDGAVLHEIVHRVDLIPIPLRLGSRHQRSPLPLFEHRGGPSREARLQALLETERKLRAGDEVRQPVSRNPRSATTRPTRRAQMMMRPETFVNQISVVRCSPDRAPVVTMSMTLSVSRATLIRS